MLDRKWLILAWSWVKIYVVSRVDFERDRSLRIWKERFPKASHQSRSIMFQFLSRISVRDSQRRLFGLAIELDMRRAWNLCSFLFNFCKLTESSESNSAFSTRNRDNIPFAVFHRLDAFLERKAGTYQEREKESHPREYTIILKSEFIRFRFVVLFILECAGKYLCKISEILVWEWTNGSARNGIFGKIWL